MPFVDNISDDYEGYEILDHMTTQDAIRRQQQGFARIGPLQQAYVHLLNTLETYESAFDKIGPAAASVIQFKALATPDDMNQIAYLVNQLPPIVFRINQRGLQLPSSIVAPPAPTKF